MENSILGDLIDKHFFLKKEIFPDFARNRSLKIAATPLRLERGFDVLPYDENKVQYFKIKYQNERDSRSSEETLFSAENSLIWQKILTAGKNKSDIIVFPEMLGNSEMTEYITEKLKSLSDEESKSIPSLIILPPY